MWFVLLPLKGVPSLLLFLLTATAHPEETLLNNCALTQNKFSVVSKGLSEEAAQIAARLEASKAKSYRTLTREKDVTPLIARVDQDLIVLQKQKQDLLIQKNFLLQRKEHLVAVLAEKREQLLALDQQRNLLANAWDCQLVDLQSLIAQKSIQNEKQHAVAQAQARDTLLARVFQTMSIVHTVSLFLSMRLRHAIAEDVRG